MSYMLEHSQKTEYALLNIIAKAEKPVGAGFLADSLQEAGEADVSEATVGRYLRQLERKGFVHCEKYNGRSRGRVISEKGKDAIQVYEKEIHQAEILQASMELFAKSFDNQLKNVMETRLILEPELAALAAQNAKDEDIASIRRVIDEAARLKKLGLSMAPTDALFHIEIARATGNTVLISIMQMIRADRDYSPEIERIINDSTQDHPCGHQSIFEAIEARNPKKAKQLMRQHLNNVLKRVSEYHRQYKKGFPQQF